MAEISSRRGPAPADAPFEPSRAIGGMTFTGRHVEYTAADTWYPTWGSDDTLYSPWTDGTVGTWACGSVGPLAATGRARITGADPFNLRVEPIGTHFASPLPYGGRYPCGSLVCDGVWYYGTYCLDETGRGLDWDVLGPFVGFHVSHDLGLTWSAPPHTPAAPIFGETGKLGGKVKLGAPHFVDFGRELEHSPDGRAYLIGHGAERRLANLSWISGDGPYMCRVRPSVQSINDPAAYEFWTGETWHDSIEAARPLFEWADRVGHVTMTYFAPLGRYLMCVTDGWPTIKEMNSYVLESVALTGPWRLVSYMERFGPQAYFLNFPSRFIGAGGRTAWLCYSANFVSEFEELPSLASAPDPPGSRYGLCLQEVELLLL